MRYYSTLRPIAPGSVPEPQGNDILEFCNYDSKVYCEEIGREVLGYIDYQFPLTDSDADAYGLLTIDGKPWYTVLVSTWDKGCYLFPQGLTYAKIVFAGVYDKRPEDWKQRKRNRTHTVRHFDDRAKAEVFVNSINRLCPEDTQKGVLTWN